MGNIKKTLKVLGCGKQNLNVYLFLLMVMSVITGTTGTSEASIAEASYIIYQSGGTVYAQNGQTGVNDYSGTDAKTVIQSALNAGNVVYIKEGTYTLTSNLYIANNRRLVGAQKDTTILRGSGYFNELISMDVNSGHVLIENLLLDGNKASGAIGAALRIISGWDFLVRNVRITQTSNEGIRFYGTATNIGYGNFENIFISNCNGNAMWIGPYVIDSVFNYINMARCNYVKVEGTNVTSLWFDNIIADSFDAVSGESYGMILNDVNNIIISHSQFYNCLRNGLVFQITGANDSANIQLIGNYLGGNGTQAVNSWSNLVFYNTGTGVFRQVVVANNVFVGSSISAYGIYLSSTFARSIIEANSFDTSHLSGTITGIPTGMTVKNNPGYVTENNVLSSTFAIDSTGLKTVTIPHGLAVTPNKEDIVLTVIEETNVDNWGYNLLKVDSVDATNVVAKIYVSTRSTTAGATARLSLRVGKP